MVPHVLTRLRSRMATQKQVDAAARPRPAAGPAARAAGPPPPAAGRRGPGVR